METTLHKTIHRPATTQPAASARPAPPKTVDTSLATRLESPYATRFMVMGGLNLFRTREGRWVEMPDDFTVAEAIRLETEALLAQQKLGKGPPPEPVPDVKRLAKKEEKADKPKLPPKGKKPERGKGKALPAGAALAAMLQGVGASPVARYLAARGAPVLSRGVGMLQALKKNEQTHDEAPEKLKQTEMAVVIPPAEGQSKSNTGQVGQVSARPTPVADEKKAKQKLQDSLLANAPRTIEDVDNFKRDAKAQHMGADVLLVVQGDKNAVVSTFGDIGKTPAPLPPDHNPVDLPPPEAAPPTPILNLGQGAIAPLQKEHTDVTAYTKQADSKLQEEGITQEQLDMVDSGDLAAANKEKKGMEATAKSEPMAVQKFAMQASVQVDTELKQDEKRDRDALNAKRKAGLIATSQKQKGAKGALEKKREDVANKINDIYTRAQNSVKKKLADLETQSMKRFDDGNAQATKEFEDNVNREIDAFKDDRYSGWFGWARRAKDWLLGIDDLPEVKAIFDRNRTRFVNTINHLVESITADSKRIIQECKTELDNARKEIQEFVTKLEPSLKEIGKNAAEEMNAKLADLDQFVAKKEQDLQNKLKDKQTAAIKAIDEKIEKMKEAMSGALAKLGRFLLWAAKKFFTWALSKFGYSLEEIESIINKGVAVLKAIFTQPIRFVKNLFSAASTGFQNFAKNFPTHLKDAVFEWLTGSLEGIKIPSSWTPMGIASVAFQMLGLTWKNIRGKLANLVGETTVQAMEDSFELVKTLVHEGPIAAWEKLKEMADDIKQAFVEGVKDFIKIKIVQEAVKTVVALIVPGAGIIRAIVAIYDTIVFFIQKAKDIAQMIGNFLSSIGEIAAGNIAAAADALEQGLARALSLVIHFLVRFLRLGGITAKIRASIQKLHDKVDAMLNRVAEWIAEKAKKLWGKAKQTAVDVAEKLLQWWKKKVDFKTEDGSPHQVYFKGEEDNARVMIASNETDAQDFLTAQKSKATDSAQKKAINQAHAQYQLIIDKKQLLSTLQDKKRKAVKKEEERSISNAIKREDAALYKLFLALSDQLSKLNLSGELPSMARSDLQIGTVDMPAQVSAMPLTEIPGNTKGYRPSGDIDTPAGWRDVLTIDPKVTYWVKAHLISEKFHGPGAKGNLVPTRKTTNAQMSTAEGDVKSFIRSGNIAAWYNVKVSYHKDHADPRAHPFPKSINMTWGKARQKGSKWERDPGSAERKVPISSIGAPDFTGASLVAIDLNSSSTGRKSIVMATGITDRFALNLIKERISNGPFKNFQDLSNRMERVALNSAGNAEDQIARYQYYNSLIQEAERAGKISFK